VKLNKLLWCSAYSADAFSLLTQIIYGTLIMKITSKLSLITYIQMKEGNFAKKN